MKHKKRFLGAHYFIYFGTLGISLPYFNLFCHNIGFSGFQIGLVSAVRAVGVIIFPVLWAVAADRLKARKKLLVFSTAAAAASWIFLLFTTNFVTILVIMVLFSIFYSPVISFLEAFAMDILGTEKKKYGRLRVWGSLSFIGISLLLGPVLDAAPISIIIWLILGGLCAQSLLAAKMPEMADATARALSLDGCRDFFSNQTLLFLFAAFLMLVSHGAYYGFFSIHLEELGFEKRFIGFAWALASLAEVAVMVKSDAIFSRFSIKSVLVFSFVAATLRWLILFTSTSEGVILFSQILHAFSYGSFHIASILGIDRFSLKEGKTLGQAVNNAVTYGAGMTVGFLISGLIYDAVKEWIFLASALIALGGGILMVFINPEKSTA